MVCAQRPLKMAASVLAPLLLVLVATAAGSESTAAGIPKLDARFGTGVDDVKVVIKKGSLRASNVPDTSDLPQELPQDLPQDLPDDVSEELPEDLPEGMPEEEGADALVASARNESSARRLMTKSVYCICQHSYGNLQCGAMFYSLFQCQPSCPRLCHSKGMAYNTCDGIRRVTWFTRLHYKWVTCPDDPFAGVR